MTTHEKEPQDWLVFQNIGSRTTLLHTSQFIFSLDRSINGKSTSLSIFSGVFRGKIDKMPNCKLLHGETKTGTDYLLDLPKDLLSIKRFCGFHYVTNPET